jgi:hypothetical protein
MPVAAMAQPENIAGDLIIICFDEKNGKRLMK